MSIEERRDYQREEREMLATSGLEFDEPTCRKCGCSDSLACPDGCHWVQADLCSECAAAIESAQGAAEEARR